MERSLSAKTTDRFHSYFVLGEQIVMRFFSLPCETKRKECLIYEWPTVEPEQGTSCQTQRLGEY